MAYDEKLADRVREALMEVSGVEEKKMFKGVTFMVNDKMCISVSGDELMCRFDPGKQHEVAEKPGFRPMMMKGKQMNGYGYISQDVLIKEKDFQYWLQLALAFNAHAKSSKKKK